MSEKTIKERLAIIETKLNNHIKHHWFIEAFLLAPIFLMLLALVIQAFMK